MATENPATTTSTSTTDNTNTVTPATIAEPIADVAQQQQVAKNDAQELLAQADSLKETLDQKTREKAADAERIKAMEAELARFREKEAAERAAYAAAQEEKAKEVAAVFEQAYKEQHNAPLPEKFAAGLTDSFKNPDFKEPTAVMASMASKQKKLTEEKSAMEERLKAMEQRLKQFEAAAAGASRTIAASRESLDQAAQNPNNNSDNAEAAATDLQVAAHRQHGAKLHDFMQPAPSKEELPFLSHYGYTTGTSGQISVNASATGPNGAVRPVAKFSPAPPHRNLVDAHGQRQFPGSMRYQNPSFFNMMVAQGPKAPMHMGKMRNDKHGYEHEDLVPRPQ